MGWAEDGIHFVVGALLLVLAGVELVRTVVNLVQTHEAAALRTTDAINGVLFVIIVLELFKTVLAHFETSEFQLKPFLIIGMISAVRHILTIGARLTLVGEGTVEAFRRSQIELGVNSGVVLALAIGLLLVRTSEPPGASATS